MAADQGAGQHRKELQDKLDRLGRRLQEDYDWYRNAKVLNGWLWHSSQLIIIVAGFATSILAAYNANKLIVVLIPAIGSLAATLQTQFRFRELYRLREEGRIEVWELINQATAMSLEDPQAFKDHRARIRQARIELTRRQARGFFDIISKPEDTTKLPQSR